jgi:hypothetical protein
MSEYRRAYFSRIAFGQRPGPPEKKRINAESAENRRVRREETKNLHSHWLLTGLGLFGLGKAGAAFEREASGEKV